MRVVFRSAPVLLVMGVALAGCARPPDPVKGGPGPSAPESTVPEATVPNQVVLDIADLH
jgi:hypothetical protein